MHPYDPSRAVDMQMVADFGSINMLSSLPAISECDFSFDRNHYKLSAILQFSSNSTLFLPFAN